MDSSSSIQLGKIQRILLLIFSVVLAAILLIMRIGLNSTKPLDSLARNSLPPEIALNNGSPTIIEFYADWCEVCQEMAPTMLSLKNKYENQIDIVLLNVDNDKWSDLLEKYEVNGIPQLNLFDQFGVMKGKSVGKKNIDQLNEIMNSLLYDKPLENLLLINRVNEEKVLISSLNSKKIVKNTMPRSHG